MIKLKTRQAIPCAFTIAALIAGLFSILKSASGDFVASAQFIMLSMILDGMDGTLARLLRGTSRFGAELDTFVDITSFGTAPAVLLYLAVLKDFGFWGILLSSVYISSGAIRLSRFRIVDPRRGQGGFLGLPITACAGWTALFVFVIYSRVLDEQMFSLNHGPVAVFFWITTVAMLFLQVSQVHYAKPTKELVMFVPSIFFVGFLFLHASVAIAAAIAMIAYGIVYVFISPMLPKHVVVEDEEEPLTAEN